MSLERLQAMIANALMALSFAAIASTLLFAVLAALTEERPYFWAALIFIVMFYLLQMFSVFLGGYYGF